MIRFAPPLLLLCGAAALLAAASASPPVVKTILSGYGWIENVGFDCDRGYMFASAFREGEVVRVDGAGTVTKHLGGQFKAVLGYAIDQDSGTVYVAATRKNGTNVVVRFPSSDPDAAVTHATLEHRPNGMGFCSLTGRVYAASEGDELPGAGVVYEIAPDGTAAELGDRLWAADGLHIDQERGLLYVGNMWSNKISTFNVTVPASAGGGQLLSTSGSHGFGILDDFTLSRSGREIVGAAWVKDELVAFPADASNTTKYRVVMDGVKHPTSAKYGCGPFPSTSLFVTEAGDVIKKDARLLEYVDFPL